ncbi:MAG: hypothetical protein MZW92_64055 [Comamonadaceae bacterium]|nr:hypothetical protein [Comamonadaceae bacterium]
MHALTRGNGRRSQHGRAHDGFADGRQHDARSDGNRHAGHHRVPRRRAACCAGCSPIRWCCWRREPAAGYFLHKYEKEIVLAVSKASGMGKDFILQQKENLEDIIEEAKEAEEKQATPE